MFEEQVLNTIKNLVPNLQYLTPKNTALSSNVINNDTIKKLCSTILNSDVKKISVIITDKTRPTPVKRILNMIIPYVKGVDVEVVFATGTHEMSLNDAIELLGNDLCTKIDIHIHNAVKDSHTYLGNIDKEIPIELLTKVIESNVNILVGYVFPHPWAGFSGGSKLLLPGISSRRSIVMHHLKYYSHPKALPTVINGNIFRETIDRVGEKLNKITDIYTINIVAHTKHKIYGTVGDLKNAYHNAVELSHKLYVNTVDKRYDVLILDSRPLNINLYQATKGVLNNIAITKRNSLIILITECKKVNTTKFIDALRLNESEILNKIEKGGNVVPYILALHMKNKLCDKELIVLTKNISSRTIAKNIIITNDIDSVIKTIVKRYKLGQNIALVHKASSHVNLYT